jgi:S-adenosylmethionine hydrolase
MTAVGVKTDRVTGGTVGQATRNGRAWLAVAWLSVATMSWAQPHALVLQTDFGLKDGAVAAMKGVAVGVDLRLPIFDLSHENTPYDVWEAAYRLKQTAAFWPAGTVFVSVVDPGVGTDRRAVVLRTRTGHVFVSPDNGTLTLVAEDLGIAAVRQIDDRRHRLPGSEASYTFHGRDLFAVVGAKLAAGNLSIEDVGPTLPPAVVRLEYVRPIRADGQLTGGIPALDPNYGNVWTNIPGAWLAEVGVELGDRVRVTVRRGREDVYREELPYVSTFGAVEEGKPLLYLNSLLHVAFALNQASFAERYAIRAGADWAVTLEPITPPHAP